MNLFMVSPVYDFGSELRFKIVFLLILYIMIRSLGGFDEHVWKLIYI